MKKIFALLLILTIGTSLASCKTKEADLVATFYPHYDVLKNISKDKLSVELIVPFGAEVHDFSPTPKDIVMINNSKLFVYASSELDVWVKDLVHSDINIINMYEKLDITFDSLSAKMHYWTDPFVFMEMIDYLKDEIIKVDPDNSDFYETNASNYKEEILETHNELKVFLETASSNTLFFAGHDALGGFEKRYNLKIIYLIDHFSPEAEHTIKQIEFIIESLKKTNTQYLFIEELVEPRVANTIKDELLKDNLNITLLELHGYHNITKDEGLKEVTYAKLFKQNVKNIKQALN